MKIQELIDLMPPELRDKECDHAVVLWLELDDDDNCKPTSYGTLNEWLLRFILLKLAESGMERIQVPKPN